LCAYLYIVCILCVYRSRTWVHGIAAAPVSAYIIYYFERPMSRPSGNAFGICWTVSYKYKYGPCLGCLGVTEETVSPARQFPRPGGIYIFNNILLIHIILIVFPSARYRCVISSMVIIIITFTAAVRALSNRILDNIIYKLGIVDIRRLPI